MTEAVCPSEEDLSRALGGTIDPGIAKHVEGCSRCRATQEGLRTAIAHAKALPDVLPDAERTNEVRTQLLARAAAEPMEQRRRPTWIAGAAAAAALIAGIWFVKSHRETIAPHSHVVVRAGVGARYELSPPPWETVRLWEGRIDLDVDPLGPGDRVRVQVGDGEVEVRGTRFQVSAHDDHLVGVEVTHGRVEVRPAGQSQTVLGAGQTWQPPAARPLTPPESPPTPPPSTSPPAPAVPLATAASPLRAHSIARRAPRGLEPGVERALRPSRQEELYDDAWDALRGRRFDEAAVGFERVLSESPTGPLADEAAFWRATSLARGGHPEKAVPAFQEFVRKYRSSRRLGEASTILGWLLVDAHRTEEAAAYFRGAVSDADGNVRRSARDGLRAIARP